MDLFNTLLQRKQTEMGTGASAPAPLPNTHSTIPSQMDRFVTAEKMKQAYQNGWNPNPFLVRIAK